MRKLDKQYIVNLVENLVGKESLQELSEKKYHGVDEIFDIGPTLLPLLRPKIAKMNGASLARIILYSHKDFQLFDEMEDSQIKETLKRTSSSVCPQWNDGVPEEVMIIGGKTLLEYLALLTIADIIQDIVLHHYHLTETDQVEDELMETDC